MQNQTITVSRGNDWLEVCLSCCSGNKVISSRWGPSGRINWEWELYYTKEKAFDLTLKKNL